MHQYTLTTFLVNVRFSTITNIEYKKWQTISSQPFNMTSDCLKQDKNFNLRHSFPKISYICILIPMETIRNVASSKRNFIGCNQNSTPYSHWLRWYKFSLIIQCSIFNFLKYWNLYHFQYLLKIEGIIRYISNWEELILWFSVNIKKVKI